mmetsp:Transcript_58522/g.136758  ORF Transcript_58522/g.136758 Transcript_58522/m.136758 type:complete len:325 (-) Transcript_58522:87-1061(-)
MATPSESQHRYVFLVRHGKSRWNLAQEWYSPWGMFSENDHPLCPEGREQAEKLRLEAASEAKLQAMDGDLGHAAGGKLDLLQKFFEASVIITSPLTRAVQTACIGLQDRLLKVGELKLLKEAREQRNFGSADCTGVAVGADIKKRAVDELEGLYDKTDPKDVARWEDTQKACDKFDWDVSGVEQEWWLNQSEDESAVGQRIDTLLEEVRSLPSGASAILVTHSQLIRCFFKRYADSPRRGKPELESALESSLVPCCAVIGCRLEWDSEDARPRICSSVQVLGPRVEVNPQDSYMESVFAGCCSGKRHKPAWETTQLDLDPPPSN